MVCGLFVFGIFGMKVFATELSANVETVVIQNPTWNGSPLCMGQGEFACHIAKSKEWFALEAEFAPAEPCVSVPNGIVGGPTDNSGIKLKILKSVTCAKKK